MGRFCACSAPSVMWDQHKGRRGQSQTQVPKLVKLLIMEVQELVGFQKSQVIILIYESSFVSMWDVEGEVKYK